MKAALLVLLLALPGWAQNSKFEELDRKIAAKERELATLKAERAKLAGETKATPQEQAMWKDPAYARNAIQLDGLRKSQDALSEKIQAIRNELELRDRAYQAQTGSRVMDKNLAPAEMRALYGDRDKLGAQLKETQAKMTACELELMILRKKYGVTAAK